MKAKDFDKLFDEGKDVTSYLDTDKKVKVEDDVQRVNVDFPRWMVDSLDGEAKRLGISRQKFSWLPIPITIVVRRSSSVR